MEKSNMEEQTKNFFSPAGIVLIGASQDPAKLGYAMARNLVESGYPGKLHFVNPRPGTLFNQPLIPRVADIPDPVDLAVLLIPAPSVPQALEECGQRGIRSAVIASGGFREMGAEGAALERECVRIAQACQMQLIGPNCVGLIDTHLPMNATFLAPPGPPAGELALLSQSGAICAVVIDWARSQGLGFSRLISLGNQADLNETDLLSITAQDENTKVITMYLEEISNGRRFLPVATQVTRQKPVVALKVGRSDSGRRAAASHTGSLAGQDAAYEAAFRRSGVIRAATIEELFDWARALAWSPVAKGKAAAVLTNAGGPGVTAADGLELQGLYLADLQSETRQQLRNLLPPAASVNNPVDLLASASPAQYAACLNLLVADPGIDSILVILVPPPLFSAVEMFESMIPIIHASPKPILTVLMGDQHIQDAVELLRSARIPEYRFPERAAAALAALAQRGDYLNSPPAHYSPPVEIDPAAVSHILSDLHLQPGEWLPAEASQAILQAYGIATPPQILAKTVAQALAAANHLGLGEKSSALALKIASPDIPHKSDVGGVILDVTSLEQLQHEYNGMLKRIRAAQPQARLLGVHIQPMLPTGQDVILGVVQDLQFGPMAMFGSGGVEVEGLRDIAFGIGPLNDQEADSMMASTWAGRKLHGFRSLAAVDIPAVRTALIRLAQLAVDFPQLAEIEINPLRAMQQGVYALDVRIRLGSV
jgi:acetate---CoA ligase (ADP-forming)